MRKIIRTILAAGAVVLCGHAAAGVLNFEDVLYAQWRSSQEMWGLGNEIYTRGYWLRYEPAAGEPYPVGFFAYSGRWRYTYANTIAVGANSCAARTTLTAEDNNPFDLISIAVQEMNGPGDVPAQVTFVGVTSGQEVVTHSVTLNNTPDWETVTFPPAFRSLQYVSWLQGDCTSNPPHMFDDIVVMPSHSAR